MGTGIYVRVSTIGQNIDSQKNEIQRWLDGNGIKDATWFIDKATGTNLDRPAFEKLQSAIFNGEIQTVVCWKLDRLSRSLKDGIIVLCDWCERGLRVVATSQQIDFNGSLGKILAAVLLGVAQMENETRRERQAAGIKAAKVSWFSVNWNVEGIELARSKRRRASGVWHRARQVYRIGVDVKC